MRPLVLNNFVCIGGVVAMSSDNLSLVAVICKKEFNISNYYLMYKNIQRIQIIGIVFHNMNLKKK